MFDILRLHVAGHASPAGYCQFKQSSGSRTRLSRLSSRDCGREFFFRETSRGGPGSAGRRVPLAIISIVFARSMRHRLQVFNGSSMVFAILCLLPDASIRVTAKKISPFSALSLNTPTHAFPKASLISAPLVPIKRPATRAVGSFASLDCPEAGLFNPNVSNAAQTFS
jgi:hypothetical protein